MGGERPARLDFYADERDDEVVKDDFRDVPIECWEHASYPLGLQSPFLCLKADSTGIESLISALAELESEGPPAKRTVSLRTCDRKNACATIRLRLSLSSDDLRQMSLTRENDVALLEFAPNGLRRFIEAVAKWQDGLEDFGIHPVGRDLGSRDRTSGEVWFWREQSA